MAITSQFRRPDKSELMRRARSLRVATPIPVYWINTLLWPVMPVYNFQDSVLEIALHTNIQRGSIIVNFIPCATLDI
jgi:hypothetical protein